MSTPKADRNRRVRKRAFLNAQKHGRPCMDCGQVFPHYCMDFDHRPGVSKNGWLNKAIAKNWSYERIAEEIEMCDLVCAVCHRKREWQRKEERIRETRGLVLFEENLL